VKVWSQTGLSMGPLSSNIPMTVNAIKGVPDYPGFSYHEDKIISSRPS
jgi:hypothetical protein